MPNTKETRKPGRSAFFEDVEEKQLGERAGLKQKAALWISRPSTETDCGC